MYPTAGGPDDELAAADRPYRYQHALQVDLVCVRLDLAANQVIATGILVKLARAARGFLREQVPDEVAILKRFQSRLKARSKAASMQSGCRPC